MATVWRARDELLKRPVALKVLREHLASLPEARRRFLHEARSGSLLDHPGIVDVYDFGEQDGTAYIAFALVEGETLSVRASRSLLPIPEAVRIVSQTAAALAHAHARGVVHRDVTGRNVLLANDGRVFLVDFGLALAAGQTRLTTTDTALGTVTYMAPEILSSGPADTRSDVYSIGVVLYEALTGAFPFVADRPEVLFYRVVNGRPRSPSDLRPDIPPDLERFVIRALDPDPRERPEDASRFLADLREVDLAVTDSRPQERAPRPASGSQPAGRRRRASDHGPGDAPTYLAVLPFEDPPESNGGDGGLGLLGRGLAETLSSVLAATPGVRVIPPARTVSRGEAVEDPEGTARRLGANLLLTGSLRRSGTRLRVTYSLIDPTQGIPVAGDTVEGATGQIFDLEDALACSVRRALGCDDGLVVAPARARPRDPAAREHYLQALGYLQRHDDEASLDGAIRLLEHLVESEGETAQALAALGRAYLGRFRLTSARVWESRAAATCQRALTLDAGSPEVLITLGDVHTAAGRPDDAVDEYRRALAHRPEAIDAWIGLARAQSAADRMADAEAAALRVIELNPADWRGHNLLGLIHFAQGHYTRAVGPWTKVVELTPDNALGHSNLGSALHCLDRVDEAVAEFRRGIGIRPHPWAYTNLGCVLYFSGRFEEAADAFRLATALAPSDPLVWGNLGNASRWIAGHETEAAEAVDRAIVLMQEHLERNPMDAGGWSRLAGWLAARRREAEARRAVERALSLVPDDVNLVALAGSTYFLLGDRTQSFACFEKAVRNGYGATLLLRDPELAPLREDPEFRRILEMGPAPAGSGE